MRAKERWTAAIHAGTFAVQEDERTQSGASERSGLRVMGRGEPVILWNQAALFRSRARFAEELVDRCLEALRTAVDGRLPHLHPDPPAGLCSPEYWADVQVIDLRGLSDREAEVEELLQAARLRQIPGLGGASRLAAAIFRREFGDTLHFFVRDEPYGPAAGEGKLLSGAFPRMYRQLLNGGEAKLAEACPISPGLAIPDPCRSGRRS